MEEANNISLVLRKWLSDSSDAEKSQVFYSLIQKKRIEYRDKSTNTSHIPSLRESIGSKENKNTNGTNNNLSHEKLMEFLKPYFLISPPSSDDSKMNKPDVNLNNVSCNTDKSDDSIVKNLITEKYRSRLNGNQKRRFAHTIQKCKRIEDVNRILNIKKSNFETSTKFNTINFIKNNINSQETVSVRNEDETTTGETGQENRTNNFALNNCEEISRGTNLVTKQNLLDLDLQSEDRSLNNPSNMTNYSDFPDEDISTSRVSTLLSLTPQFPNRIDANNVLPSSTLNDDPSEEFSNTSSSKDESLITEASFHHEVISQVTKALTTCTFGRNVTRAYLEAEKLLLLSMHKRDAVLGEIHRNEYDVTTDELVVRGEVKIENLHFSSNKVEPNQWYTLVAIAGSKVLVTEIVSPDERGNIIFQNLLKFDKLENDFEILLKLYYLKEEGEGNTSCPHKIKSFFKLRKKTSFSTRGGSSFMLWGTSKIQISNLENKSLILNRTSLNKDFSITSSSELKMKGIRCGFLTLGYDVNGVLHWGRFWCRLEGFDFKYYNYPSQETYAGCIDLRYCINAHISKVKREKCARPRTLHLVTGREPKEGDKNSSTVIVHPNYTISMYFLSADNLKDMDLWQTSLNTTIGALRNWNKSKFSLSFASQEERFI